MLTVVLLRLEPKRKAIYETMKIYQLLKRTYIFVLRVFSTLVQRKVVSSNSSRAAQTPFKTESSIFSVSVQGKLKLTPFFVLCSTRLLSKGKSLGHHVGWSTSSRSFTSRPCSHFKINNKNCWSWLWKEERQKSLI